MLLLISNYIYDTNELSAYRSSTNLGTTVEQTPQVSEAQSELYLYTAVGCPTTFLCIYVRTRMQKSSYTYRVSDVYRCVAEYRI